MINAHLVSYAQNREDVILDAFFEPEEKGFYVDIGAYDPDYDSVTKLFYLKDWRGINVEPQADRFVFFEEKRLRDININTGISDKNTTLKFRSYTNQGLSTFSEEMKSDYEHDKDDQTENYVESTLKVVTLEKLFTDNKVTSIQFMKVDVEGLEYEVLAGNDWAKYRPEVICIEANHIQKDWRPLLQDNDYELTFFDGLNEYYADKRTKRGQKFDYVTSVVFKEPIVNFKLLEEFDQYEAAVTWLDQSNKDLEVKLASVIKDLHSLQRALEEITPFRKHAKKTLIHRISLIDQKITSALRPKRNYEPASHMGLDGSAEELLEAANAVDSENFSNYTKPSRKSLLLPAYVKTRGVAVKSMKKTRAVQRKIRKRS